MMPSRIMAYLAAPLSSAFVTLMNLQVSESQMRRQRGWANGRYTRQG